MLVSFFTPSNCTFLPTKAANCLQGDVGQVIGVKVEEGRLRVTFPRGTTWDSVNCWQFGVAACIGYRALGWWLLSRHVL